MIRVVALALLLAPAALAQEGPRVTVTLEPPGAVTVGTPLEVTATVLVPTWMPDPPVWPDLQIADAITRMPERATRPVTERIGRESWSGVARTWEIVPQRAADYDLGDASVTVTYADPATNQPAEATLAMPGIAFSATVPAGAEGMDPFLAATSLSVEATVDGLPRTPKPGDAFTLTLTTTASGPPAILLPPLAERLPVPPGLRAYPRAPVLDDGPPARRTEAIAYVIESPGSYLLPAVAIDWWNTASGSRERAATAAVTIEAAGPAGAGAATPGVLGRRLAGLALLALAAGAVALGWRRRRRPRPPTEASAYRALRRTVRSGPVGEIRPRLADWRATLARDARAVGSAREIEAALVPLERTAYGPAPGGGARSERARLLAVLAEARSVRQGTSPGALPPLNAPAFDRSV
jgi:hypothetical protein